MCKRLDIQIVRPAYWFLCYSAALFLFFFDTSSQLKFITRRPVVFNHIKALTTVVYDISLSVEAGVEKRWKLFFFHPTDSVMKRYKEYNEKIFTYVLQCCILLIQIWFVSSISCYVNTFNYYIVNIRHVLQHARKDTSHSACRILIYSDEFCFSGKDCHECSCCRRIFKPFSPANKSSAVMQRVQICCEVASRDIVALTRMATAKIDGTRAADTIAGTRTIFTPLSALSR